MSRMACVEVPSLSLQILLRQHKDWKEQPAAVVDRDHPQGVIQAVNQAARRFQILPGMRYAAALSLSRDLRAGVVSEEEIRQATQALTRRLQKFSPDVEPARGEPGVFWLNVGGLERVHESLEVMGRSLRERLQKDGLYSRIAVGWTRFGTYAAACTTLKKSLSFVREPGLILFETRDEEVRVAAQVPLDRLHLEPAFRDFLDRLGIRTVGQFLQLPSEGVWNRFGEDAHRQHRSASGQESEFFQAEGHHAFPLVSVHLDYAERNTSRLMHQVDRLLEQLLAQLERQQEELSEVVFLLRFERGQPMTDSVSMASPTRKFSQVKRLFELKLHGLRFPSGVVDVTLFGKAHRVGAEQLGLFVSAPRRDLSSAGRAFDRIRAEFGEDSVVCARLREAHLPEAGYRWERLAEVAPPQPAAERLPHLVRRVWKRPRALPPQFQQDRDGWLLNGDEHGPVVEFFGPYVISGGWWRRSVHREYYFARLADGDLLWVYHDRLRRKWFVQGEVG